MGVGIVFEPPAAKPRKLATSLQNEKTPLMGGVIFDVTILVTIFVTRHSCRDSRNAIPETRTETTPTLEGDRTTPSQGGNGLMQLSCQTPPIPTRFDFTKLSKQYIVAQLQLDHIM